MTQRDPRAFATCTVAGVTEVVGAVVFGEGVQEEADAVPEGADGSLGGLAQQGLEKAISIGGLGTNRPKSIRPPHLRSGTS